jgi:hypothetical protein
MVIMASCVGAPEDYLYRPINLLRYPRAELCYRALHAQPYKSDLKGKAAFPAAGFLVFCLVWGYFGLPETKDQSFKELDILFGASTPLPRREI